VVAATSVAALGRDAAHHGRLADRLDVAQELQELASDE